VCSWSSPTGATTSARSPGTKLLFVPPDKVLRLEVSGSGPDDAGRFGFDVG
jgi:hypothetical protein